MEGQAAAGYLHVYKYVVLCCLLRVVQALYMLAHLVCKRFSFGSERWRVRC